MKYIFKFLRKEEKKISGNKSPVYVFFAEANEEVKAKAYEKALRGAAADQMSIISRYDKEFAKVH